MVAAVVVDQIGRIGGHEARTLSVHHVQHVLLFGRVTTQQAVRPQRPEIIRLADRLGGDRGHCVGVGQASCRRQVEMLLLGDALQQAAHGLIFALYRGKQLGKLLAIGAGHGRDRVEARQHEALLVFGEFDEQAGQSLSPRCSAKATRRCPSIRLPVCVLTTTCCTQPTLSSEVSRAWRC